MENRLYTVLSCLWRNTVLKYYRGYLKNKELKYWEERIKHFGWKNRNKTFYVIRRRDASVSYTHLDVYKRQIFILQDLMAMMRPGITI